LAKNRGGGIYFAVYGIIYIYIYDPMKRFGDH